MIGSIIQFYRFIFLYKWLRSFGQKFQQQMKFYHSKILDLKQIAIVKFFQGKKLNLFFELTHFSKIYYISLGKSLSIKQLSQCNFYANSLNGFIKYLKKEVPEKLALYYVSKKNLMKIINCGTWQTNKN